MILSLATALTTLALLASPAAAGRIRWRHAGAGDSRRWLVTCNSAPYGPSKIGTPFVLAKDYHKYCSSDWTAVKDELAQIYTGGMYGTPKTCFDGTSEPGNGVQPHLWTCYDGLDVQQWVFRSDGHIELGCTGLCLDVKDGYNGDDVNRSSVVQLWECVPGSRNQEWDYVTYAGPGS